MLAVYRQNQQFGGSGAAAPTTTVTDQGVARNYLAENLVRVQKARDRQPTPEYNLTRLLEDDRAAADFILALVTKGLLDECNL